jgi:dTDP-4-dehydrorhamnose reductase
VVILGSTGMLGQALMSTAKANNIKVTGVARSNADINLDVVDSDKLTLFLRRKKPKIIINCVAITDINLCERDAELAYQVNAHLVSVLVDICRELGVYLIHISTDHFFVNDGSEKHDEESHVVLVNNYAKTKYKGERFALGYDKSLVIRTNIVGFRNQKKPTFIEWILSSLQGDKEITVFQDFFTSSIDVDNFSKIIFKIITESHIFGLFNIASSEVLNKAEFITKFSYRFGYEKSNFNLGFVKSINGVKRAESLGLNVSKIEKLTNSTMPTADEVIESLYNKKKEICLK